MSEQIIGAAIDVHRAMGPGLLESVYQECMLIELTERGLACAPQARVPIVYKGHHLGSDLRVDILVENCVVVELKAVDIVLPVHEAQVITYLRLTGLRLGLLINFNVRFLREGIKRFANGLPSSQAPVNH